MKRILVGIDGSEQGWSALDRAAALARATRSSLQVVHVITPVVSPVEAGDYPSAIVDVLKLQEESARVLLRQAVERAKDAGVEVDPISKIGAPAEILATLAQAEEVTMAVVGHRGRNLAARLLIGSVADRLVQICPKPVLVVR